MDFLVPRLGCRRSRLTTARGGRFTLETCVTMAWPAVLIPFLGLGFSLANHAPQERDSPRMLSVGNRTITGESPTSRPPLEKKEFLHSRDCALGYEGESRVADLVSSDAYLGPLFNVRHSKQQGGFQARFAKSAGCVPRTGNLTEPTVNFGVAKVMRSAGRLRRRPKRVTIRRVNEDQHPGGKGWVRETSPSSRSFTASAVAAQRLAGTPRRQAASSPISYFTLSGTEAESSAAASGQLGQLG